MWRQERFEAADYINQIVPVPPVHVERFENRLQREFQSCQVKKCTRHCYLDFTVKKKKNADGTLDLYNWVCIAPGPIGTPYVGGLYKFYLRFPDAYPFEPPVCQFDPGFYHPNVDEAGILNAPELRRGNGSRNYTATCKMYDILHQIVFSMVFPDPYSFASSELKRIFLTQKEVFESKVKRQVRENDPLLIQEEFEWET
ncbi:unnamed protein product [Caenorhabditis brenneri]